MMTKHPQVAGRAVVVQDHKLLLVRGDGDGTFWTLPGGRADTGEDVKSCVQREVYEETGIKVKVGPLFAVSEYCEDAKEFHILQVMFHCDVDDGDVQKDWVDQDDGKVVEVAFFTHEEIQKLPIVFPSFLRDGTWRDAVKNDTVYHGIERK